VQILFVTNEFVWPAERGGRVRTLSQLRVLTSLPEVERIRLFTLREDDVPMQHREALARDVGKLDVLEPVFHPIHLFTHKRYVPRVAWLRAAHGIPYLAGKWESPAVRRALQRELQGRRFDVVWLEHLGTARYLGLVRRLQPRARVVLDQQNVDSDIWAQFARRQRGLRRLIAESEWRAARRFERDALRAVDAVSAISLEDARAHRELAGVEAVTVPQVVPFMRRPPPPHRGPRFAYVGNLTWHPNARGLGWFFDSVWPQTRDLMPDATLEVAGSGLPTDARGAPVAPQAWRAPGVTMLGFVPDLTPVYERSAALVAPILGGSGVRIKLLEAFRQGVPVVTTPDGAAGLPIEPGREAFVESEPRAFAARLREIASSSELQARLREAGYSFLERHHALATAQTEARALLGFA
jgi:glycosyltransferase involved in cell wall biosynthesis